MLVCCFEIKIYSVPYAVGFFLKCVPYAIAFFLKCLPYAVAYFLKYVPYAVTYFLKLVPYAFAYFLKGVPYRCRCLLKASSWNLDLVVVINIISMLKSQKVPVNIVEKCASIVLYKSNVFFQIFVIKFIILLNF